MNPEQNLDYLAAKHAQDLVKAATESKAKDLENTVTKALGVLQENGVYACFLYLTAREDNGSTIIRQMRDLLAALGIKIEEKEHLDYARQLTADLPTLLLAKEALEQMLIYARYGAKAASI